MTLIRLTALVPVVFVLGATRAPAPPPPPATAGFDAAVQPYLAAYCLRCHDEDNSPHFDFAKYWSQVVHKQLDQYNDPKVHRGLPPKDAPRVRTGE